MNPVKSKIFILAIVVIVSFTLIGFITFSYLTSIEEKLEKKTVSTLVKSIEISLKQLGTKGYSITSKKGRTEIKKLFTALTDSGSNITGIRLIDQSYIVRVSNRSDEEGIEIKDKGLVFSNDSNDYKRFSIDDEVEEPQVSIMAPIEGSQGDVTAYLNLIFKESDLGPDLGILRFIFPALLALFILVLFYTISLQNKIYRNPLEHLDYAISKMDEDDFSYRVKYQKKDEFTDTFIKLNRTIEKVGYLKDNYKNAEKRIVSLLKAVNEGILVVDTKKNVTSFNDATYRYFKSNKNDFPEWFIKILATNRELSNLLTSVLKEESRVKEKELTVFLPDESEILVRLSIQALKEENNVQGAVLTFKDLQSIKELENNLLRSMKYGVITNLASSISHEIKNPLSAMALHAEILEGRLKKIEFDQKSQVLRSLETLQDESRRLNRIIQQFLTLARPSKLELNLIHPNRIIEEVLELVHQQAQEDGISIFSDLDPSLGVIYGDEDQLKQVILNIVLNAFSATNMGGRVDVITRKEYERVLIQIIDTGRGIPIEIRDKIFDLYFTTKKDGGGIGLSVCQNIIKAHDGRIEFESEEGKGTTFNIHFPTKDPSTIRSTRIKPLKKTT